MPGEALEHFREAVERGAGYEQDWQQRFEAWRAEFPELAAEWDQAMSGELPAGWDADIPVYEPGKPAATRNTSGEVLNAIAQHIPTMIGGDADLAGSTKTLIKGFGNTGQNDAAARNVRFGVREHAMGAIVNGLALHGGIIKPFSATFLTFSDYMRPSMRLGALMNIPAVYVFTHDSIGLGEDGPTHQPVEHFAALRAIPNLTFIRPADANETAAAWRIAMMAEGPVALAFSRQDLPVLENGESIQEKALHGGYIVDDSEGTPQVILISTGSELQIVREAYQTLMQAGIKTRVVSIPSWEVFDAQDAEYKESVLPKRVTARVSVEAGVSMGWQKYVGTEGICISIERFGASAPYEVVYEKLGITVEAVVDAAKRLV